MKLCVHKVGYQNRGVRLTCPYKVLRGVACLLTPFVCLSISLFVRQIGTQVCQTCVRVSKALILTIVLFSALHHSLSATLEMKTLCLNL